MLSIWTAQPDACVIGDKAEKHCLKCDSQSCFSFISLVGLFKE